MFKNEYQNEMSKIKPSKELINRTKTSVRADMQRKRKRPLFRTMVSRAMVAAIICLLVFGNIFPNSIPPTQISNNSFVLTAFAAEQQPDGTITTQRQLEFNQTNASQNDIKPGAFRNFTDEGEFIGFYICTNIAFKCEGSNIKEVVFSVDEGYFSIINTDNYNYFDVERLDATHTMSKQELANSKILWGFDVESKDTIIKRINENGIIEGILDGEKIIPIEKKVTITATVTFEDGEVQEKSIVYDTEKGLLMLNDK